nr:Eco57I restriction-modification methylase domain-containing protein [uncultured Merdimonas sp.]
MKFDFVIGNPPYQDNTIGENDTYAPPVYNKFLDAAYQVADKVEMIHPARFLFNAGSTPKAWNRKMLSDEHFKVLDYEGDASKIFPNTDIKGGVAITYHDTGRKFGAIGVFTKFTELNSIMRKAAPKKEEDSIIQVIYLQNKFNLDVLYEDYPMYKNVIGSAGKDKRFRNNIFDKIQLFSDKKEFDDDIRVLGVSNNKRIWKYIPHKYVDTEHENLNKWKVLVPRVNGAGKFGESLSSPLIIEPTEGYTQTFIGIGAFLSKEEAENAMKYIKSKFCRTMLGILKITQDNNRDTWRMVPLQDFSSSSDIDWSQSIANIDKQLYKKYNLSDEEINFIETYVKEME